MIKSILMIAALFMVSFASANANTGDQATSVSVNPGENPADADSKGRVEGGVNLPGIESECKPCKAFQAARAKRLKDQTVVANDFSIYKRKERPVNEGLERPGSPKNGGR